MIEFFLNFLSLDNSIRAQEPAYFSREAIEDIKNDEEASVLWLVTDCRQQADLEFFKHRFGERNKTIRIVANENVRAERGWQYIKGIDDSASECNLDQETDWDFLISNNNDRELNEDLAKVTFYLENQNFYS